MRHWAGGSNYAMSLAAHCFVKGWSCRGRACTLPVLSDVEKLGQAGQGRAVPAPFRVHLTPLAAAVPDDVNLENPQGLYYPALRAGTWPGPWKLCRG